MAIKSKTLFRSGTKRYVVASLFVLFSPVTIASANEIWLACAGLIVKAPCDIGCRHRKVEDEYIHIDLVKQTVEDIFWVDDNGGYYKKYNGIVTRATDSRIDIRFDDSEIYNSYINRNTGYFTASFNVYPPDKWNSYDFQESNCAPTDDRPTVQQKF